MLSFEKKLFSNFIFYIIFVVNFPNLFDVNALTSQIENITDEYTIEVFNADQELKLICNGFKELKWTSRTQVPNQGNNTINKCDYNTNICSATLIIPKPSYLNTDYYRCENKDGNVQRMVYAFVNDTNHIFLPSNNIIEYDNPNQNITIPCRATSPDIKFDLIRNYIQAPNFISYDPKQGATINLNGTSKVEQYICTGSNKFNKTEKLEIIVRYKKRYQPCVTLLGPSYILPNVSTEFSCEAVGNPTSKMYWGFKKCSWNDECPQEKKNSSIIIDSENLHQVTSLLTLSTAVSGTLICEANNTEGGVSKLKEVVITDIPGDLNGFNAWIENEIVFVGDSVVLQCGVTKYNFTGSFEWYLGNSDIPLTSEDGYHIHNDSTEYSHRKIIKISNVTKNYDGKKYRCDYGSKSKSIYLYVKDPEVPVIYHTNLENKEIIILAGRYVKFYCAAAGSPFPTITWKKNGKVWVPGEKRIKMHTSFSSSEIIIFDTIMDDEGNYSCEVSNRFGKAVKSSSLLILDDDDDVVIKPKTTAWLIIASIFCFIILIIVVTLLFIKLRNVKRRFAEFENVGLDHFGKGNIECKSRKPLKSHR